MSEKQNNHQTIVTVISRAVFTAFLLLLNQSKSAVLFLLAVAETIPTTPAPEASGDEGEESTGPN